MWNEGDGLNCEIRGDLVQGFLKKFQNHVFMWKDLLWEAIDVSWSVRSRLWGNCVAIVKRPQWEVICVTWSVRSSKGQLFKILFDQWGQMWETIVVRSVRSCRSVRSSGGLVLQWGAKPLRQIWVQWEHPSEGDLFCGCRLRPNHVRSCVCDCIVVGIGVHVVLWGAYLVDSAFLRLMQERVEEW